MEVQLLEIRQSLQQKWGVGSRAVQLVKVPRRWQRDLEEGGFGAVQALALQAGPGSHALWVLKQLGWHSHLQPHRCLQNAARG